MTPASSSDRRGALFAYIDSVLSIPAPAPAAALAAVLSARYPGAAIFLYGSGISVSASEDPAAILFDFYVIAPDYESAIGNRAERFAARALAPNVYYLEAETPLGSLRAKYALLSVPALERFVSRRTFHSYFWARFAQPMRLVACPASLRARMTGAVGAAAETFLGRARGLAPGGDWRAVWLAAMNASYRAELRAEGGGRAEKLIDAYGEWPRRLYDLAAPQGPGERRARLAWRLRAVEGGFLSVARLLKATATFKGGLDYIAWKVKRHAGVDVGVRPWERRHPFLAAPVVALRYYRLRAAARR
ncbi:MAG TPA: hypothetical protein DEA40_14445 [Parvularcula sp.]|nr:hypothetical protein [Parvularcula sp.]